MFSEYFKELEEESIRDNFVIIYELLDELMDFGFPQTTDSKILQECVRGPGRAGSGRCRSGFGGGRGERPRTHPISRHPWALTGPLQSLTHLTSLPGQSAAPVADGHQTPFYWGVTCLRAVNEGVRKRTSLFGVLSFRWDGPHGLWIGHLREQALCEHLTFTRPQPEVPSPPLAWEQRHTQRSHVAVS